MRKLTALLLITGAILLSGFWSCNTCTEPLEQEMVIHPPVWLDFDTTRIWYGDYLPPGVIPDSIIILDQKISFDRQDASFVFESPGDAPAMYPMHLWSEGKTTAVLLKRSLKVRIPFRFNPAGNKYTSVALKGEFNGWTPAQTPLEYKESLWQADLVVPRGKYQYLVVADGKEMLDPACTEKVDNNSGGFNSLLHADPLQQGELPVMYTRSFTKKRLSIKVKNQPVDFIVLWNNTILDREQFRLKEDVLEITIPREAACMGRSWIRAFAWNGQGIGNDLLIPLDEGKVVSDPAALTRTDLHTSILYNVFVDRFFNGNPDNDKHLPDSIVLPKANYYGGDIAGVLGKVEEGYFDWLGVNTLWLSPVVKNADGPYGQWVDPPTKFSSYHGYWPTSFTEIDSHFGTPVEFRQLVERVHHAGMNILLDFVAHHIHQDHPWFKANPGIATSLYLSDGTLNTERWDEYRLTTWFDVFLPTLNLEKPEVASLVADSTVWWVKEYQIDGYRHDAAKHIPLTFWRSLTSRIREQVVYPEKRPVYQIGETYGGVELIGSYLGSGLLDGQFDFNVFDAALGAFAGGRPFGQLAQRMWESTNFYGSHNLMGNITGNQDRARFISYAGGDLKFEENAKAAGWSREIGIGDQVGYKRLQMMMAFIMTIPGVPVIYYGDEFGMPGGNDPDSRRMMKFGSELNDEERENIEITRRLTNLRRDQMALLYGDLCYKEVHDNILAYARTWFGNTVIVAFNNGDEPATVRLDVSDFAGKEKFIANFGNTVTREGNELLLSLPGNSFEIFTLK